MIEIKTPPCGKVQTQLYQDEDGWSAWLRIEGGPWMAVSMKAKTESAAITEAASVWLEIAHDSAESARGFTELLTQWAARLKSGEFGDDFSGSEPVIRARSEETTTDAK